MTPEAQKQLFLTYTRTRLKETEDQLEDLEQDITVLRDVARRTADQLSELYDQEDKLLLQRQALETVLEVSGVLT